MKHHYSDIRSRIAEEPTWFDEYGVPRYGDFTPHDIANIYADQCVLLLIACQQCGLQFHVCMSSDHLQRVRGYQSLWDSIDDKSIHYGDPPNVNCCSAGATMNCIDLRVIEAWDKGDEWERQAKFEVPIEG